MIFKYFWFVCAALMLVNIIIWQRRVAAVVSRGVATQAEVDHFIRWASVWLVGSPIALGVISLVAGWSSPFCAGVLAFDSAARSLVSLVMLAAYAALLWWVWRGKGADFLARVAPALNQRPSFDRQYSVSLVRTVATAAVLIGGVGSAIVWRTMPQSPAMVCPVSAVVGK